MPRGGHMVAPGPRTPALGPTNFARFFFLLLSFPFLSSPSPPRLISRALVNLGGAGGGQSKPTVAVVVLSTPEYVRIRAAVAGLGFSLDAQLPRGRDHSQGCSRRMQGGRATGVGLLAF